MKFLKYLDDHLEEVICVVALAAMTVVIFVQIWFRQDKNAEKGLQKVHSSTSTIRPGGEP